MRPRRRQLTTITPVVRSLSRIRMGIVKFAVRPIPTVYFLSLRLSLAIFGEVICSLGFIVGAFYRLALIPMIFTMCIAFFVIHGADPFAVKELALVYLAIFVLMYIAGPGNYSVDRLIAKKIGGGK